LIRPFLLRRRKEQVASDLPPKTEIVREVVLEGSQARLYESIRVTMEQRVRQLLASRGLARSHIEMLDALLKLRQTCCHPKLVKLDSARGIEESAKTELLIEMLTELISEGKKILLFSQFTEMLGLIESEVMKAGISYVKLTGRTRKRDEVIDAFQHGEVPLFLISLKAGGTGLNLTAADTVIHYDPWWNPAVENQASDRAHRIGQTKPVFIYKLVASNTVEEKIMKMQQVKKMLADQTLNQGENQPLTKLSTDEVISLFSASADAQALDDDEQ
jgi:SNF2 family DNA or RNA helicase